jgi:phosphohistidine phosphatase
MKILLIRHAIAMEREDFAPTHRPDSERPLTDYGRRQMRRNARALSAFASTPEIIATSPFARAAETARIVARAFGVDALEPVPALEPERSPRDVAAWLNDASAESVALVGHEPDLGLLATWLISGRKESAMKFEKGGAALLIAKGKVRASSCTLRWLVTPVQLR